MNKTALMIAQEHDHNEVLKLLVPHELQCLGKRESDDELIFDQHVFDIHPGLLNLKQMDIDQAN